MSIAAGHQGPGRGAEVLLAHCEALETDHARRAPVAARLRRLIGPELTRLLLAALTGDYRVRSRLRV
jgi:hypothetical protein